MSASMCPWCRATTEIGKAPLHRGGGGGGGREGSNQFGESAGGVGVSLWLCEAIGWYVSPRIGHPRSYRMRACFRRLQGKLEAVLGMGLVSLER